MKKAALICCCLSTFQTAKILAQQSIWEGSKQQLLSTKEKGEKKVTALKKWKNHIQQWGLDSNYNHAISLSGRLNTNGWSAGLYYIHQKSAGKKTVWALHFSEIRHEKEAKQQYNGSIYTYLGNNTAYVFGKINSAYALQLAYGRQQLLLPALLDGNLSISLRYSAGPALTLLKPYYLNLIYVTYVPEETAHIQTEKFSPGNADKFLQAGSVHGAAPWNKGLGETKYIPGLFAEVAFVIEPDKNKSFIQTLTIGGNAAYYSSKIEIMAQRKAYPYQASFFVGLALGKRWK